MPTTTAVSSVRVEVAHDVLGWLLVYAEDGPGVREGDPVGDPDYYQSSAAAKRAAKAHNDKL